MARDCLGGTWILVCRRYFSLYYPYLREWVRYTSYTHVQLPKVTKNYYSIAKYIWTQLRFS